MSTYELVEILGRQLHIGIRIPRCAGEVAYDLGRDLGRELVVRFGVCLTLADFPVRECLRRLSQTRRYPRRRRTLTTLTTLVKYRCGTATSHNAPVVRLT